MITLERTVHVERPIEQVFGFLIDFTNAEQWDPGTVSCTLLRGDGGVGTQYRNVSKFLGRSTELVYEVKQVDVARLFVIVGKNKTVTSTDTITVTPLRAGTRVTYRAVFDFHGLARLAEPLLKVAIKRLGDRAEETLHESLMRLPA
jgi:carbon monoxide dehydrogenase subunit G